MPAELTEQLTKDRVLAKVPAFSPVVLRVVDLLSRDTVSVTVLAQTIASDPNLAAQVLRLANSALFGAACRIDTVKKAVLAVGNGWVQHLTLTVGAGNYVKAAGQSEELKHSWRHTVASAVLSRELAKAAGLPVDRAYALGLLHDIGRLGLLAAFPAEYSLAIQTANRDGLSLISQERSAFGVDHCELGRLMVQEWNLPVQFGETVGRHHELTGGGEMDLPRVVQLACRLADTHGFYFVPPANPISAEELLAMLPDYMQQSLPDSDHLIEMVEQAISEQEQGIVRPAAPLRVPRAAGPATESEHAFKKRWVLTLVAALIAMAVLLRSYW